MRPNTRTLILAAVAVAVVGLVAWPALRGGFPAKRATASGPSSTASAAGKGSGSSRMLTSADKVGATVRMSDPDPKAGRRAITVLLHIKDGWHVNANPASLPFLIATAVEAHAADASIPLQVKYPPGRDSGIRLDGKSIMVFDDNVSITAYAPAAQLKRLSPDEFADVTVTVQSCSDQGICLPPSTLEYPLTEALR